MTGPSVEDVIAEALSWLSGEMTRWSPTAHPDHNRWSWRGDGHGEATRAEYRRQATAVVAAIRDATVEQQAELLGGEVAEGIASDGNHVRFARGPIDVGGPWRAEP